MRTMLIPKVIHYCWISNDPWDVKTLNCFDSWKKTLIDYEFKIWNLETLPQQVIDSPSVQNALKCKKWAFVADYVRIWAIYTYGGVYMDLDVELVKKIDPLLYDRAFLGMEKVQIGGHVLGAIAKHEFFEYVLDKIYYKTNFRPLPDFLTCLYKDFYGVEPKVQLDHNISIYANEYFNPFTWDDVEKKGCLNTSDNTYCIHWYAGSWIPKYKFSIWYKLLIYLAKASGLLKIIRYFRGY